MKNNEAIERLTKFIIGIKSQYAPDDTPFLKLYDEVYVKHRNISFSYAQEAAIRAVVTHVLNELPNPKTERRNG
jgi:hypothetical protein